MNRSALAVSLVALLGCQDRVVYSISVKHGVATIELRLENLWRDGIECAGAAQCADVLDAERKETEQRLVDAGGTVIESGFQVADGELDEVVRYTIPVEKLDASDQIVPIRVQRRSDVRADRPGVPSIAVLHLSGSATTVEMWGPATRMTGAAAMIPGVAEMASAVGGQPPELVLDVLTRGRGRALVVIPSTDTDGKVQHRDGWISDEAGLEDVLALRGLLLD